MNCERCGCEASHSPCVMCAPEPKCGAYRKLRFRNAKGDVVDEMKPCVTNHVAPSAAECSFENWHGDGSEPSFPMGAAS